MVVAVGWSRQTLRARDNELKYRNAAARVLSGDQEANRERPETDDLVGRIDAEIGIGSAMPSDLAGVKSVRKAPRVWQGRLGLAAVAQILK